MPIYKCKMCGGDLEIISGQTVCECEYCGSRQTLPKLDDERKLNLYDRANHFRRNNEFDKAAGIYERILNDDTTDAEAYWSLVLCKYGIEYVEDPATHKRLPTVNRAQYTSIFADENYKKAIEYADPTQREVYEAEARAIDEIQKGILEISSKEEPFDVFICYKETDNAGRRTPDSVLATELYHELTKEGFKVFFSRITLEDKLGTAYEPYIFAALHSAKAMVVLGTRAEYFSAVWVKNEWSRYLNLIQSGEKKTLIPAYRDMDPYDLPEEFSHLQAQDMSKLGFMQDLIRGIKKILDADKKPEPVKETVVVQQTAGNATLTAQIKRGQIALEDRDWTAADGFFDKALDIDAECAEAYFGKALAAEKCATGEELVQKRLAIPVTETAKLEACPMCKDRIDAAVNQYTVTGYYDRNMIAAEFLVDGRTYESRTYALQNRLEMEEDYWSENRQLVRALQYAKGDLSRTLQNLRAGIDLVLNQLVEQSQNADSKEKERLVQSYAERVDSAEASVRRKSEAYKAKRQEDYEKAVKAQESSVTASDYRNAGDLFLKLGAFSDSKERMKQCREREQEIQAEAQRRTEQKAKAQAKKVRTIAIATVSAIAVIVAVVLLVTMVIIPAVRYNKAEALLEAGDYDGADVAFKELGDYKDSMDRVFEVHYAKAEALLEVGDYDGAAAAFAEIPDYKDSATRVLEIKYTQAEVMLDAKDYMGAISAFSELDYKDSKTRAENIRNAILTERYEEAETLLQSKDYSGAIEAFLSLNDYKDSAERVKQTHYLQAEEMLADGDYDDAITVFSALEGYNDSDTRVKECIYAKASYSFAQGDYKASAILYGSVSDYEDALSRSLALWNHIAPRNTIAAGGYMSVGVRTNGTVVGTGAVNLVVSLDSSNMLESWTDIVSVSVGSSHIAGLKADGTVVAAGDNIHGECDTSKWTNIVAVSAGGDLTVGLKADGTVIAIGDTDEGECVVSDWSGIVAVASAYSHIVGLKSDGTVVATGSNKYQKCNVTDWSDIVAISVGPTHTVGLKADGTVVAVGQNDEGQCDTADWTDIVAISAGTGNTIGLKSDGTVVAVGHGQSKPIDWTNIVSIAASQHVLGLKNDGTVVATGYDKFGQCDVNSWIDVKLPDSVTR